MSIRTIYLSISLEVHKGGSNKLILLFKKSEKMGSHVANLEENLTYSNKEQKVFLDQEDV